MDCRVCLERYDAARRRPKVLPCGHSACLACLEGLRERRCPECRREFQAPARGLLDNFALLERRESRSPRAPRMWCVDCKAVARPQCFDDHTMKSVKNALKEQVAQLQVRAAQLAEKPPGALCQDGDGCQSEQALRVLELARQPGTNLEVSVRGQGGEALTATWTNPPAVPAGRQGAADDVGVVATDVLALALAVAKKGVWQQRGVKRRREGEERPGGQTGALVASSLLAVGELRVLQHQNGNTALQEKLLRDMREHKVRRLRDVWCSEDPDWPLPLLRLAAALPHVEDLHVSNVRRQHLAAVLAIPGLRSLDLHGHSTDPAAFPGELPPPPADRVGLRWLRVQNLPRETTLGVVRAHATTLDEVRLYVGTAGTAGTAGEDDLPAALGRCGLARLRRLVLSRPLRDHDLGRCAAQLAALRGALPGAAVHCDDCDAVASRASRSGGTQLRVTKDHYFIS